MKKVLIYLLTILVIFFSITNISSVTSNAENGKAIILSEFNNVVSIHTNKQKGMLSSPISFYSYYGVGKIENSRPNPVVLSWETELKGTFEIKLSEYDDFSKMVVYTTTNKEISIYNLKIATRYYWQVSCGENNSEVSSFETEGYYPRNLNVDKVSNVRDIGGFVTSEGAILKQGLLYRGGRFNKVNAPEITISEKGAKTLVDTLNIKTEIDLRVKSELGGWTDSILNTFEGLDHKVKYYNCPLDPSDKEPYYYLLRDDNIESTKKIFEILADKNNYPIYFHCSLGTDRAGELADILHYLCSVPTEDVDYDYAFSNLAGIGSSRDHDKSSRTKLQELILNYGETINRVSTTACLKDKLGLSDETINNIVNILVDSSETISDRVEYENCYLSLNSDTSKASTFIFDSYSSDKSTDYVLQMKIKASDEITVKNAIKIGESRTEKLSSDDYYDVCFSKEWQTLDINIPSDLVSSLKYLSFVFPENVQNIDFCFDDIVLLENGKIKEVFNTYQHYDNDYQFIKGTNYIYCDFSGSAKVISDNVLCDNLELSMLKGAEIRLDENNGLRFITSVNTEQLNSLINQGFDIEFGTLIAPADYLETPEDLSFDLPINKYLVVPYEKDLVDGCFKGSLVKIMETSLYDAVSGNMNRGFVGRGYAKISKGDKTTTIYAELNDNIRSVSQISYAYKNDVNSDYSSLSDTLKSYVEKWASYYKK